MHEEQSERHDEGEEMHEQQSEPHDADVEMKEEWTPVVWSWLLLYGVEENLL